MTQQTAQPAGSRNASRLRQSNKGQGGGASLSYLLYFGCSLRRPGTVPSLVHAPSGGRTGIPGHSQPERKRASFRAVNPPSSRASRVGAGVEPRYLALLEDLSRPAVIPRRADIAGGPARSHPHAKPHARVSRPCKSRRDRREYEGVPESGDKFFRERGVTSHVPKGSIDTSATI